MKSIDNENPEVNLNSVLIFRQRLWPYIRNHKKLLVVSLTLLFTAVGAAIVIPWLLGYIVDRVLVPKRFDLLIKFALLFFSINLLRAICTYLQSYYLTLLGQRVLHELRQDLFKQYQFYPVSEFNTTATGRMVTRLVNDTSSIQDLFTGGIAIAFADILIVVGIVIGMISLHPRLGVACVAVFPLMIWSARYFAAKLRITMRESRVALSRLNTYLAENISGMWLIQVFNQQSRFKKKFDVVSTHYTEKNLATIRQFAYFMPAIAVISSFSMAILIYYGGFEVLRNGITLGVLVSMMSYIQAMYAPIKDITEKFNLFITAISASEKIYEFLDRKTESKIDTNIKHPLRVVKSGEIEFRNVSFAYPDQPGKWILKDLNLKIAAGEKIGVVGHTGAGKTTLSALLMRFYDVTKGELLIDQRNVLDWDKRAIRDSIGYIQQQPFLFSGTIADNIFLWQPHRREAYAELPSLAREPFEMGRLKLDQPLYERGTNLSAGQKQIISFLRALVQDPAILVLDEATAHVDMLTEQWVSKVSETSFKNKTVLIIAHRLATLKAVDRILVFHNGEVVESGSHKELLTQKGMYSKLYEIQSKREELEGSLS